jgi:hypothetical protein
LGACQLPANSDGLSSWHSKLWEGSEEHVIRSAASLKGGNKMDILKGAPAMQAACSRPYGHVLGHLPHLIK